MQFDKHQRTLPAATTKRRGRREFDPETLAEIHQEYFPALYRYARYRTGDPVTAEDIASEVFIRLLEAVQSKKGPSKDLRGWLFGTLSNLVNDYFRRKYRTQEDPLPETLVANGPGPSEQTEILERLTETQQALFRLPQDQQTLLSLRFGAGLSLKETAEVMGKKPNAVKAQQFRALQSLKRLLLEGVE